MIKRALLLLLLTAAWAFGSWWYYTCMIKGFCRANSALTSASDTTKTATGTAVATGVIAAGGSEKPAETTQDSTQDSTSDFVDEDNDAISDDDERRLGTDPSNPDSDGDGKKDNEELGLDLQQPIDTDNDGLIDARDNDDDNDGIPTKLEAQFDSNPLSADSDGDGISDGDELGENKNTPQDSDGDGLIDLVDAVDDKVKPAEKEENTSKAEATSETGGNTTKADDTTNPPVEQQTDKSESSPMGDDAPADKPEPSPAGDDATLADDDAPASDDEVTVDTSAAPGGVSSDAKTPVQKSRLYFPFRSANPRLSQAATTYFKGVASWLNENPSHSVVLTGHTDDIGKAKNNLNLGLKRAVEIRDMMTKLGANPAQVDVASMGETQPIASNKTEKGRRQNRRVELIPVIKQ